MQRSEFLKKMALLGLAWPFSNSFAQLNKHKFNGKVLVIGAGAADMTAAYLLVQQGIDVELLEASNRVGGRMRIDTSFADIPILNKVLDSLKYLFQLMAGSTFYECTDLTVHI